MRCLEWRNDKPSRILTEKYEWRECQLWNLSRYVGEILVRFSSLPLLACIFLITRQTGLNYSFTQNTFGT